MYPLMCASLTQRSMWILMGLVCATALSIGDYSATKLCDNSCSGHGECSSQGTCHCQSSWAGRDCSFSLEFVDKEDELAAADLASSTCLGGCSGQGRCEAGVCICHEGFFGPTCSDAACPNSCGNHGSCSGGMCLCESGWLGQRCEMWASEVLAQDSASIDIQAEGIDHDGLKFERKPVSLGQASLNHASEQAKEASQLADSLQKLVGKVRSKMRLKQACSLGCSGHGTCNGATGKCVCEEPWTGALCDTSPCPNDCSNNGMCMFGKCICGPQFFGAGCELQRCPQDCSGHGYCFEGKCMCSGGFGGSACLSQTSSKVVRLKLASTKPKEPTPTSVHSSSASQLQLQQSHQRQQDGSACPTACSKQGMCVEGTCLCNDGYQGSDCSIVSVCSGNGRLTESLLETGETLKTCMCDQGFAGRDCERQLVCADAACSGHGVCKLGRCTCQWGFSGHSCHIATMEISETKATARAGIVTSSPVAPKKTYDPVTASWMKPAEWISAASAKPTVVELQIDSAFDDTAPIKKASQTEPYFWHPALIPEAVPAIPVTKPGAGSLLALLNAEGEKGHPRHPATVPEWKERPTNQSSSLDSILSEI